WYFFGVAAFFMYLRFINRQLATEFTSNAKLAHVFGFLLQHHSLMSYSLYIAGFVAFVLQLKKHQYIAQFGQFAWTHMIILCIFIPSSFFVSNIFDGLIWFLLPCSLVIINDIGAYLTGFCVGNTPLIKLSPKKTWEGFVGGLILTVLASWWLGEYMSRFKWMICPRTDLSMGWLDCAPDPMYKQQLLHVSGVDHLLSPFIAEQAAFVNGLLPDNISTWLAWLRSQTFTARPMQLHAVMLAMFASIIAPFGGFFASGFKRGFKIKDFGDSIPGHGGMTDRMDCQVVMAVFSYIYVKNWVARPSLSLGAMLAAVLQLDQTSKLELFSSLARSLAKDKALPEAFLRELSNPDRPV
ncbi:hypothetical protein WJX84_005122, partial [Apatococcus fuscideae]